MDLWTCGPEDLWTEDIHLYEVVWTCGRVDVWTCGPVDLWTCGPVDLRTCGLKTSIYMKKCGPVDLWTCGPVDLWTEDIHLNEVVWTVVLGTCGPVDLWTYGPVDIWTCGLVDGRHLFI